MLIGVYEIYSKGGSNALVFLTEQEAKDQTLISDPKPGVFPADIYLSDKDITKLKKERYLWT